MEEFNPHRTFRTEEAGMKYLAKNYKAGRFQVVRTSNTNWGLEKKRPIMFTDDQLLDFVNKDLDELENMDKKEVVKRLTDALASIEKPDARCTREFEWMEGAFFSVALMEVVREARYILNFNPEDRGPPSYAERLETLKKEAVRQALQVVQFHCKGTDALRTIVAVGKAKAWIKVQERVERHEYRYKEEVSKRSEWGVTA
jgi:hypothetical protein